MRSADLRTSTRRLAVVHALVLLGLIGLAIRATHLAVFDPKAAARGPTQSDRVLVLAAERGQVVDRRGETLAISVDVPSVYAIPGQIEDPEETARAIAPLVDLSPKALRARLRPGAPFRFIARWIDEERAERLVALDLPGVGVIREPGRRYPNGPLAAQLLGFTNIDGVGVRGVEQQENGWLSGTPRRLPAERDGSGRLLLTSGSGGGTSGGDVMLTLDATLQAGAERALQAAVAASGARGGVLLSMDPKSGEILALAESPASDPNGFRELGDAAFRSVAFLDAVEPGSVMKAFLMAAALDAEVVSTNSVIDCEDGAYRVPGKWIRDHEPYGKLDLSSLLRVSSNIGAVKIAQALEPRSHFEALRRFGFGENTGSGFPAESQGILRNWENWQPVDHANIAYGQGVSVTAVQIASAAAALANEGELLQPRLIAAYRKGGEAWRSTRKRVVRRVVGREHARQVLQMLESVVGPEGTGRRAALAGVRVAGKTGTAQKWDREEGRYSSHRFRAWFVGIAPAEDPRLVVVSSLDEPARPRHHGGDFPASLFAEVASGQLASLGIHPSPPTRTSPTEVAQAPPASPHSAAPQTTPERPQPRLECPSTHPRRVIALGSRVLLPDLQGLCARQVMQITETAGLHVNVSGSGHVIRQHPPAGTVLPSGARVRVELAALGGKERG